MLEEMKRASEIKVYLTEEEFKLAEARRSSLEEEFGMKILRSQFFRRVLLAWDRLEELSVEVKNRGRVRLTS